MRKSRAQSAQMQRNAALRRAAGFVPAVWTTGINPAARPRPLSLLNPIESVDRSDNQTAVGQGGRRQRHLLKGVLAQEIKLLAGPDNECIAILAQTENLAVAGPRRRGER